MNEFSDQNNKDAMDAREAQNTSDNKLLADCYTEFYNALDILYLRGNLSARLYFLESWPHAAQYLFGDELIGFDHDGTTNVERRAVLEDEAEERRLALLDLVENLEKRSVEKSVLQTAYVQKTIEGLGRDLALLLYAPKIVDRFIAPPPVPVQEAVKEEVVEAPAAPAAPAPVEPPPEAPAPVQSFEEDPLDAIKPISVEPPSSSVKNPAEPPKPRPAALDDLPQKSAISKEALDGMQPIASQKMTFMPSKQPDAASPAKPSIPVIGGDKTKPNDSQS